LALLSSFLPYHYSRHLACFPTRRSSDLISTDGKTLAYIPISTDFRTWKRYRGGMNSAIWLFNLETFAAKDITGNDAANSAPMWQDRKSTRLNSSHGSISYAVFCLKKKTK